MSQHPEFPPGLPLAPIVHPLQPQCEPLIPPDSATTSDEEFGVDSSMRRSMLSMLEQRYSKPAPAQGLFAGMLPADVFAVLRSAMMQL